MKWPFRVCPTWNINWTEKNIKCIMNKKKRVMLNTTCVTFKNFLFLLANESIQKRDIEITVYELLYLLHILTLIWIIHRLSCILLLKYKRFVFLFILLFNFQLIKCYEMIWNRVDYDTDHMKLLTNDSTVQVDTLFWLIQWNFLFIWSWVRKLKGDFYFSFYSTDIFWLILIDPKHNVFVLTPFAID